MSYFFRAMIWLYEFELAIANSTGRNPDNRRKIRRDLDYWRSEYQKWSLNHAC